MGGLLFFHNFLLISIFFCKEAANANVQSEFGLRYAHFLKMFIIIRTRNSPYKNND